MHKQERKTIRNLKDNPSDKNKIMIYQYKNDKNIVTKQMWLVSEKVAKIKITIIF